MVADGATALAQLFGLYSDREHALSTNDSAPFIRTLLNKSFYISKYSVQNKDLVNKAHILCYHNPHFANLVSVQFFQSSLVWKVALNLYWKSVKIKFTGNVILYLLNSELQNANRWYFQSVN